MKQYSYLGGTLGVLEKDGKLFFFEGNETLEAEPDMVKNLEDIKRHLKFLQGIIPFPERLEDDLDRISVDIEIEQDKREARS